MNLFFNYTSTKECFHDVLFLIDNVVGIALCRDTGVYLLLEQGYANT